MEELKAFDYHLPKQLIAQAPARPRDHARLLVYDRVSRQLSHDYFYNLLDYLPAETTLVLNNSRVEKARLKFGRREVFLVKLLGPTSAEALIYPGHDFRAGARVELAKSIEADVLAVLPDGQRRLKFNVALDSNQLDQYRQTPFPPYIKPDERLSGQYQTVYASRSGSRAAPTAGLHFSRGLLERVKTALPVTEITLHVGLGTFAPLRAENLKTGKLHEEQYSIAATTAQQLNSARHLTAVGTTALRCLESNVSQGRYRAGHFATDIFIRPGYKFQSVNALVTNFHLPRSSLMMLVGAFMGVEELQRAYRLAVKQQYRFFSFGDAMLIV